MILSTSPEGNDDWSQVSELEEDESDEEEEKD